MLAAISQDERSVWQRHAAAELAVILQRHRDLPAVAWTIGAAGCVLTGQVTVPACGAARRVAFAAWRSALGLEEREEFVRATGTAQLFAAAYRDRVRVLLTATVADSEDDQA